MAEVGSYLLIVRCLQPTELEVGALGETAFEAGYYGYAGSAFGPGGLSRVERHRRIANGDHDVRHWHIDYLLGSDAVELSSIEVFVDRDLECTLAATLEANGCQRTALFGASDCSCESHLWGPTSQETLADVVDAVENNE